MNDSIELIFDGHFLKRDLKKANAELSCIADSLDLIYKCINDQDYAGALFHIENFRRSVAELKRLNDRKKTFDQVLSLLTGIGVGGSNG